MSKILKAHVKGHVRRLKGGTVAFIAPHERNDRPGRAKPQDGQLSLFMPSYEEAHDNNAQAVAKSVESLRKSPVILASRIAKDFEDRSSTLLLGQKITSAADLAVLGQVYRNPSFETVRLFFTKRGKVVGQTGITSRLTSESAVLPEGMKIDTFAAVLRDRMGQMGADGWWMLHNHPSGNPVASGADLAATDSFRRRVPGFQGHVIVNHKQYGAILASRKMPLALQQALADQGAHDSGAYPRLDDTVSDLPVDQHYDVNNPRVPNPLLGRPVMGPSDLAAVGNDLKHAPEWMQLVCRASTGRVGAIVDIPVAEFEAMTPVKRRAYLRKYLLDHGCSDAGLVNVPPRLKDQAIEAVHAEALFDAMFTDGSKSAASYPNLSRTLAKQPRRRAFVVNNTLGTIEAGPGAVSMPMAAEPMAKAHVKAHTRMVNGKLVQVQAYTDKRQAKAKAADGQLDLLAGPKYVHPAVRRFEARQARPEAADFERKHPGFSAMQREMAHRHQDAYHDMMTAHGGDPTGVEFKHHKDDRWAVILPEMSEPERGTHRIQYFDRHGTSSHDTRKDLDSAVEELLTGGFRETDAGAMDRLSTGLDWKVGTRAHELHLQMSKGKIGYVDYLNGVNAYREELEHKRDAEKVQTYISRPVLNARELHDWAVSQGFVDVVPPEKMHLTMLYSMTRLHPGDVQTDDSPVTVGPQGREIKKFGDDKAVVLRIENPALHAQHAGHLERGGTHDFERTAGEYLPHITISYKPQRIDWTKVEPFRGELHLGAERAEPLVRGWGTSLPTTGTQAVTPETAESMRAGDVVKDREGREYLALNARHDWLEVAPIIDGKPQVSADTTFKFLLTPEKADSYPERRADPVFLAGRNLYDKPEADPADAKRPLTPDETGIDNIRKLIGNSLALHEFDVEGGGKIKAQVKTTTRKGVIATKYLHLTAIQPNGRWEYYREQPNGNFKLVSSGRQAPLDSGHTTAAGMRAPAGSGTVPADNFKPGTKAPDEPGIYRLRDGTYARFDKGVWWRSQSTPDDARRTEHAAGIDAMKPDGRTSPDYDWVLHAKIWRRDEFGEASAIKKPSAPKSKPHGDFTLAGQTNPTKKFYVTIMRDGQPKPAFLAGPFDTHKEAIQNVGRVREKAHELDPRSVLDSFGTSRLGADRHPPGLLNDHLGIGQ